MTDAPTLEHQSRGRDHQTQSADDGGNGNGSGLDSGCAEGFGSEDFQFTFSQPSALAAACAEAAIRRRKIAIPRGMRRAQGKGHEAAPMTAGTTGDEGGSLGGPSRSQAPELSLSEGGRMREEEGGEGEHEEGEEEEEEEVSLLRARVKDLEQKYMTTERHFDLWIEATKVQKEKLDKANEDVVEKDKIIMALEKQVGEDSKSIKEKQAALDRHQQLLDQARVAEKKAIQRADGLEAQLESAIKDSKGLLARCSDLEQSGHMSAKELSALRVQAKIYEDAADDIKYERDRYKTLSKEYQRLKEDFDKLGFRPDPDEHRKKAHAPPRRSLGDELAEVGSSSESENERDRAPRQPGRLGIPPVMPKEIERVVTQTITKNVYIDRTKIVDRPFQVAAHHPVLCWFQVELNFLILLFAFVSALTPIVARFASRVLGDPAVEVSASATTSSPITEQACPSNATQHPPASSTEIRPVASDPQTSTAQSTDEQPPPEADLEHIRPRVWDWSTITNPKTMPQARPTIIGFACHLIVYSLLLFVYGAYAERKLWLAANDGTRIYVRQLLDHPESFRSGMSKILFMLPDGWKHTIDRLMFKAVVLGLNLKVNHPMPG